jgi:hypothetical protein
MKSTERMIEELTGHKNPSPWGGLAALVIMALVIAIGLLLLTSCDPLNRIPLSISYQFENGSSVTIAKPQIIRQK